MQIHSPTQISCPTHKQFIWTTSQKIYRQTFFSNFGITGCILGGRICVSCKLINQTGYCIYTSTTKDKWGCIPGTRFLCVLQRYPKIQHSLLKQSWFHVCKIFMHWQVVEHVCNSSISNIKPSITGIRSRRHSWCDCFGQWNNLVFPKLLVDLDLAARHKVWHWIWKETHCFSSCKRVILSKCEPTSRYTLNIKPKVEVLFDRSHRTLLKRMYMISSACESAPAIIN